MCSFACLFRSVLFVKKEFFADGKTSLFSFQDVQLFDRFSQNRILVSVETVRIVCRSVLRLPAIDHVVESSLCSETTEEAK